MKPPLIFLMGCASTVATMPIKNVRALRKMWSMVNIMDVAHASLNMSQIFLNISVKEK